MNEFIMRTHNYGEMRFRLRGTYIYVIWPGAGEGQQICAAGGLAGNTLQGKPDTYERIARRWYRSYCRRNADTFCGRG